MVGDRTYTWGRCKTRRMIEEIESCVDNMAESMLKVRTGEDKIPTGVSEIIRKFREARRKLAEHGRKEIIQEYDERMAIVTRDLNSVPISQTDELSEVAAAASMSKHYFEGLESSGADVSDVAAIEIMMNYYFSQLNVI